MAGTASAALMDIRIDFCDTASDPAGNWNEVNTSGATDLMDYGTGLATAVDITLHSDFKKSGSTGNWDSANHAGPDWLDASKNAVSDRLWASSYNVIPITVKELDPAKVYKIELVASANGNSYDSSDYKSEIYQIGADAKTFNPLVDGWANGDWMTWNNVSPSAGGEIAISISRDPANVGNADYWAPVGAMRVLEVPEPATLLILGIGGLGALVRRRRR